MEDLLASFVLIEFVIIVIQRCMITSAREHADKLARSHLSAVSKAADLSETPPDVAHTVEGSFVHSELRFRDEPCHVVHGQSRVAVSH